jgi:hypothetical protein
MVDGDLQGVSQATVSQIVKRVSVLLAENTANFVKFPCNEEGQRILIARFNQIYGFPCIAGVIDGTHIPIQNPGGENAENFRNRKRIFSLNIQVLKHKKKSSLFKFFYFSYNNLYFRS